MVNGFFVVSTIIHWIAPFTTKDVRLNQQIAPFATNVLWLKQQQKTFTTKDVRFNLGGEWGYLLFQSWWLMGLFVVSILKPWW
jgi:hypothetical protein